MQNDSGTVADHSALQQSITVRTGGFPLPALFRSVLSRDDGYFICHHECRIKADTELSDDIHFRLFLIQRSLEIQRSAAGDRSEIFLQLLFTHADTVIDNAECPFFRICLQSDIKIVPRKALRSFIIQLIDRIARVRNQFPEKNLLIRIYGIDHHIEKFFRFCFKLFFRHDSAPLFSLCLILRCFRYP